MRAATRCWYSYYRTLECAHACLCALTRPADFSLFSVYNTIPRLVARVRFLRVSFEKVETSVLER
jgi:hypothetical protein